MTELIALRDFLSHIFIFLFILEIMLYPPLGEGTQEIAKSYSEMRLLSRPPIVVQVYGYDSILLHIKGNYNGISTRNQSRNNLRQLRRTMPTALHSGSVSDLRRIYLQGVSTVSSVHDADESRSKADEA